MDGAVCEGWECVMDGVCVRGRGVCEGRGCV